MSTVWIQESREELEVQAGNRYMSAATKTEEAMRLTICGGPIRNHLATSASLRDGRPALDQDRKL